MHSPYYEQLATYNKLKYQTFKKTKHDPYSMFLFS